MKFEFQLNQAELQCLDRLNKIQSLSPGKIVAFVLACLIPSIAILIAIDSWVILYAIVLMTVWLILMAIRQMRKANPNTGQQRSIELTRVGKKETIGGSQMMIKWDLIDNIHENAHGFIFERLDRFSMLPKRSIETEQMEEVREFLLRIRNEPEGGHLPLKIYEELFEAREGSPPYQYHFEEEDLFASVGPMLAQIKEGQFTTEDIAKRIKPSSSWFGKFASVVVLAAGAFILAIILSEGGVSAPLMVVAMVLPFVLIFIFSKIRNHRAKKNLLRVPREQYYLRLLTDGWAAGEPNAVSFHRWNENTCFYLSEKFVGIKSDTRLINLVPNRAFYADDLDIKRDQFEAAQQIEQFLRSAMSTCRNQIRNLEREANTPLAIAEPVETGNPYQAPSQTPNLESE